MMQGGKEHADIRNVQYLGRMYTVPANKFCKSVRIHLVLQLAVSFSGLDLSRKLFTIVLYKDSQWVVIHREILQLLGNRSMAAHISTIHEFLSGNSSAQILNQKATWTVSGRIICPVR